MRAVLQRVRAASVDVAGHTVGAIGPGVLLLAGFVAGDDETTLTWMADKIVGLRIFPDAEGRMNRDLQDIGGAVLVVSQFTLYGDVRKGRRPSFVQAAPPEVSIPLYERFVQLVEARMPGRVQTGEFGAEMQVHMQGDGPVTLVLER